MNNNRVMSEEYKNVGWIEHPGGVIIRFPDPKKNEPVFQYHSKVAGFNLDNTLVKSIPKLVANRYEFEFTHQNCIMRISDLHRQDYSIVIISDQSSIMKGFISIEDLQYKFDYLTSKLAERKIPVIGIFTTKNNCFKKPHIWTWKILNVFYELKKTSINLKESMFVSNLAGRIAKHPYRSDFDFSDRAYAHNIGIEFKVPEQLFRQSIEPREFTYNNIMNDKEKDEFIEIELAKYKSSEFYTHKNLFEYCSSVSNTLDPENKINSFMIIMVGPPCSGKTTLANQIAFFAGKETIDPIKNTKKISSPVVIIKEYYMHDGKKLSKNARSRIIDNFIQDGRILIIDGSYPSHESRDFYLNKANEYQMPVIFLKLNPSFKMCRHFSHIRLDKKMNIKEEPLCDSSFKKYNRTFQRPDPFLYMEKYTKLKIIMIDVPTIICDSKIFRNIY